jgi:hypothetical protein
MGPLTVEVTSIPKVMSKLKSSYLIDPPIQNSRNSRKQCQKNTSMS